MDINDLMNKVKLRVNEYGKGHDFSHIQRVIKNAEMINAVEKEDEHQVFLLALFHDLFDEKFYHGNHLSEDLVLFLEDYPVPNLNQLIHDLEHFGFNGGFNAPKLSKVGQIVSDADRLDAMGAIGIARSMMYGSVLYDETREYQPISSKTEYRDSSRPILFHFYDKLLKLKDLMFTETGKHLAQQRHKFMLDYLYQFYEETGYRVNKLQNMDITDLSFTQNKKRLNVRVAVLIEHEGEFLVINDDHAQYDYLIGGRIQLFESSLDAILREFNEESHEDLINPRLCFTYESSFFEDTLKLNIHELGYVYCAKLSHDSRFTKQKETIIDGNCFKWVSANDGAEPQFIFEYIKEHGVPNSLVHLIRTKSL